MIFALFEFRAFRGVTYLHKNKTKLKLAWLLDCLAIDTMYGSVIPIMSKLAGLSIKTAVKKSHWQALFQVNNQMASCHCIPLHNYWFTSLWLEDNNMYWKGKAPGDSSIHTDTEMWKGVLALAFEVISSGLAGAFRL